jgi:DNA modification methylase
MTNNSEQLSLINEQPKADNAPVVCLGITFENEEARREYFREELRKKLPELKQIEGFPIAENEDIIALSDPPYYTACPNPWINDFIDNCESEKIKKYNQNIDAEYKREPFATDVSEGKNDPIYNAHSYHTKVPYKAIMRYILYYTQPGDIIYDGFAGSGMTGVAAQMCAEEEVIKELGFDINSNGDILMSSDEMPSQVISKMGSRKAVLYDIAPAATFIAYNYNKKANVKENEHRLFIALNKLNNDYSWIFSTLHVPISLKNEVFDFQHLETFKEFYKKNQKNFAKINYIVWSEQYICNVCLGELTYWEGMVEEDQKNVRKEVLCPHCKASSAKKELRRVLVKSIDPITGNLIEQPKLVPIKINYTLNKKRYEKLPDDYDLKLIELFENFESYKNIPCDALIPGIKTIEPIRLGLTHVHHFYTKRILFAIDKYLDQFKDIPLQDKQFLLGSTLPKLTKMNRFMPQHGSRALVGPMANALYFPPLSVEHNLFSQLEFQLNKIIKAWNDLNGNIISTQSSTVTGMPNNSVDYIFVDPPFGANIMYSELSFARESWLKVKTNNEKEAIENRAQNKSINEYTQLIISSFKESYRILKPNHWITVEFSNTQSSVWNAIQFALQESGFIIASVDALDKKRGGFHAMITTTAVKQDLVISAYKPSEESVEKMRNKSNTPESAWIFVSQHLEKLPVFLGSKRETLLISERTPRILFDRMVAYHVQTGLPIPISSPEFQVGVSQRFPMRDGMAFLESQVAEYDKRRTSVVDFSQQTLFVSDENSAIEWIRQQLMKKPQTRQDLHPQFMKEIQHIAKHEQLPEVDDLLVQNFLRYEGDTVVPDQIASYLRRNYREYRGLDNDDDKLKAKAMNFWYVPDPNKQADLEKLREKTLLREFENYVVELGTHKKKLSHFRTEAVRAGFKKAWTEKDYNKIVNVGDRLPETVIQEDDKLLMYYDNAQIRIDM